MPFEPFQVPVDIWISEVVVQYVDREIDVRQVLGLVAVVLSNPDRVAELVSIGREWVPVQETDVLCLPCLIETIDCSTTRSRQRRVSSETRRGSPGFR